MNDLKQKRIEDRQKKLDEKNNAKLLRLATQEVNNFKKSGECLKLVTVIIDERLIATEYGPPLKQSLLDANLKCRVAKHAIPYSITWEREEKRLEQSQIITTIIEEPEMIIFMDWHQTSELVATQTLEQHILEKKTFGIMITIAFYGLQGYFKHQKTSKSAKSKSVYNTGFKISAKELESQLTELQILADVNHRTVETQDELNLMIFQYSKSMAEAPAKLERQAKQEELNCFIKGANKDCVRVDKDGNGLQRVWQQQLMQIPLMSLEVVHAIIAEYPSPNSLFEKLADVDEVEGPLIFQDLLIRRAAGPIAFQRKVGPEMSKKIYNFFVKLDGDCVI